MSQNRPTLSQVLAELKLDYLRSFPEKLKELERLTQLKDFSALAEEYHKLKGTGKTYGFPEVSVFCEQLEFLALAQHQALPICKAHPLEIFPQAVAVLAQVHQHYAAGQTFDLQQDPIAKSILALPLR